MNNTVNALYSNFADLIAKPAASQPQPKQQSTSLPQDTVSLKSTGDVDHDGDSH